MKPRVLLVSSVHPNRDPRIIYKIAPSLEPFYEVFCALPNANQISDNSGVLMICLPNFKSLLARIILTHPIILWKCLRLKPDVIHIFVAELIPAAFLFQCFGAKVIYEVQENLYKKFQIKKYNNGIVFQMIFRYFDQLARKNFYCLFTEHAYLNEYRNLTLPSAVVHNYVSLPFINSSVNELAETYQIPTFFYCGVISMDRCFDTIVAASMILEKKHSKFHIHFFGPIRFKWNEAEALSGFHKVSRHFTFHGYTDLRTALSHGKNCLAGIALLKPVADYPDSYTTKLFEYMALSLPVITSDFPLYREVVERAGSGFCISPYDANALSNAFCNMIENPEKAAEMGSNGRNAVESWYNWESEEKILLSFYENIVSSRNLAA